MRIARRRWIVLLGTAILGSSLPAITAPTAFATPVCTGSVAAGLTYTCAPSGSGSVQVTVPAGVASINVTADGGGGGKNDSLGNGGSGARVNATISVTPGDRLTIYVGAGGGAGLGSSGNVGGSGYGAGGSGGAFYGEGFGGGYGGGGGGSSAVVIGSTVALVAGGGGGGGNYYGGSAAGTIGGSGGNGGGSCAVGGGGGNATGSGSAGTTSGTGNPTASSSGYTGHGGGGIYGAGGASSGGGGGGGGYGGGGPGNWNGPGYGCTLAGGGGAGGSYAPSGAVYGSASNAGGVATSGAGGDGQVAIQFIAVPATVPGAPTDLVFSGVSTNEMTLYWTPPASDGGSALLGYDVSVNSGTAVRVAGTSQSLTGLTSGTTYSVSITAVNSVGSSSTALTGSQQTTTRGAPTGPATNLVFSSVSSTSITASWTAPTAPNIPAGWPILGYQVRVDSGTLTWSPSTSYIAAGLTPGVLHSFEITVVNGAGASTALTGSEWTYATAPDAPTNLVFSGVTSSDITASWTAPTYNGGAGITTYWVSVDGGASIAVGNVPSYTATGLTPSTWHSFAITAMNLSGSSPELTGSRSTNAPAGSPRITATSGTVGTASTITLIDFPASSTQTVMITAPDSSMTNVTVTVNGAGSGTGIYTPTSTGSYSAVTSPNATSATFTATSVPTPVPGPASGSSSASGSGSATQAPTIAPASQLIEGTVGAPVDATATLALAHFTRPATFTIAPTLPAGLALDPLTGVVSGTPVVANASTGYVITANAGSEVATSALRVSIVARSAATASIVITGRAGRGQLAGRIYVTGHATRLAGTVVRVRVRFAGHPTYTDSGTVRVAEDGAFTWQRRARQRAFVYVLDDHGTRSNRVIIAPVR